MCHMNQTTNKNSSLVATHLKFRFAKKNKNENCLNVTNHMYLDYV